MSICVVCKKDIEGTLIRSPMTKEAMHIECFNCANCKRNFKQHNLMNSIYDFKGKPWCGDCYIDEFEEKCPECNEPLLSTQNVVDAFGANFHQECLMTKKRKLRCRACLRGFDDKEKAVDFLDGYFHERCFKCSECSTPFNESNPPGEKKGKFICEKCHDNSYMDTEKCCQCNGNIMAKEDWTNVFKLKIHRRCLKCKQCSKDLEDTQRFLKDGKIYCKDHK
eukprot:TRINITY_DN8486_c0_g2_i1.p1 TRINITY_DN8486_c0_g2~~TRINITY_DN8486_c0_g2_i1.p1  ORF type:complete len:229 (+),score=47.74 TRINITY_DN8486_c0_g2_i1:24-689(+)